jgi:RNA polymerase sigma-70 factor (ECF subfamily)
MPRAPDQTCSDEELVRAVAAGDAQAFGALYDRYERPAYGLAFRITRSRGAAEDVVQEVFLGLWRGAGGYDAQRGAVRPWLLARVRHRSIDSLRRNARHLRDVELDPIVESRLHAPERTDDEVLRVDEARRIRRFLSSLSPTQQEVIELAFFRGLTHVEIAAALGAPLGTVKSRSRLALQRLHTAMTSEPVTA